MPYGRIYRSKTFGSTIFEKKIVLGFRASFTASEGEKEAGVEFMLNFCLGIDKVNRLTLASLKEKTGKLGISFDECHLIRLKDF